MSFILFVKAQAPAGIQILMKRDVRWRPYMVRGFLISDIPQNECNKHVDTRNDTPSWTLRAMYLQEYINRF